MYGKKAWGVVREGTRSTEYGWVDPSKAEMHDPRYCTEPIDAVCDGSPDEDEVAKGGLVHVVRKTVTEVFIGK